MMPISLREILFHLTPDVTEQCLKTGTELPEFYRLVAARRQEKPKEYWNVTFAKVIEELTTSSKQKAKTRR